MWLVALISFRHDWWCTFWDSCLFWSMYHAIAPQSHCCTWRHVHGNESLQYHAVARQSHCCAMTFLSFPSPFRRETLCLLLLFTMNGNRGHQADARASWIFINTCWVKSGLATDQSWKNCKLLVFSCPGFWNKVVQVVNCPATNEIKGV